MPGRRRCKPLPLPVKVVLMGYPSEESSNPSFGQAPGIGMKKRRKEEKAERETTMMTKDERTDRE